MNISIIGGGITGLTTALALHKVGIPCRVYERAPELNEVGAGIWMAPNAMKVFKWLGIDGEIRNNGVALRKVEITNSQLKPIRKAQSDFILDAGGDAIISIHRARLQAILYRHLPAETIHLNKEFISLEEKDNLVTLQFKDETVATDLLLGADGIKSKVRESILPHTAIRYSGQTCWRGVADIELMGEHKNSCLEAWGKGIRFGFSVIAKDKVYWFAVAKAKQDEKDTAATLKEKLIKSYATFHPLVKQLLENTSSEKIIRNDISDLKRLTTWSKGRVCLLGDAAHATTPNLGQGAAQGIEDAFYISRLLKQSSDHKQVFSSLEKYRRTKVDHVVNISWMMGQVAHHPIGQPLFKLINKFTPEVMVRKQMQNIYMLDAE